MTEQDRRINACLLAIKRTGEIEYVEQLWEEVSFMVRHIGLKYLHAEEAAQDFVQEFWADIHKIAQGFVFSRNGRAYLRKVATNRAINCYRKQKREAAYVIYVEDFAYPEARTEEDQALRVAVSQAMNALSETERIIIQSAFFEQKTVRQIASELGLSKSQVARLKDRALETLKELLT